MTTSKTNQLTHLSDHRHGTTDKTTTDESVRNAVERLDSMVSSVLQQNDELSLQLEQQSNLVAVAEQAAREADALSENWVKEIRSLRLLHRVAMHENNLQHIEDLQHVRRAADAKLQKERVEHDATLKRTRVLLAETQDELDDSRERERDLANEVAASIEQLTISVSRTRGTTTRSDEPPTLDRPEDILSASAGVLLIDGDAVASLAFEDADIYHARRQLVESLRRFTPDAPYVVDVVFGSFDGEVAPSETNSNELRIRATRPGVDTDIALHTVLASYLDLYPIVAVAHNLPVDSHIDPARFAASLAQAAA